MPMPLNTPVGETSSTRIRLASTYTRPSTGVVDELASVMSMSMLDEPVGSPSLGVIRMWLPRSSTEALFWIRMPPP